MKIILLFVAIMMASYVSFGQKSEGMPTEDGKIIYHIKVDLNGTSFLKVAKIGLGKYVNYYNSTIQRPENKLQSEYIVYEDSTEVDANVKYNARQSVQASLFSSSVKLVKHGDAMYMDIYNFTIEAFSNLFVGKTSGLGGNTDNMKPNSGIAKALDKEVKMLISSFN